MKLLIPLLLLFCGVVSAQGPGPIPQTARRFTPTTFAGLGTPSDNSVRWCGDCQATAPCTSGGTGAYAYGETGGDWNCNVGAGGGGVGTVTSVSGTANQIEVATGTTTPALSFPANGIIANNVSPGLLSTATAAGTTTLTVASKGIQVFTGSTTQIVVLPVVSTLPQIGFGFVVQNDSSGAVTVNSSGGNAVQVMAAGTRATFTCKLLTGTDAASWNVTYISTAGGGTPGGSDTQVQYNNAGAFSGASGITTDGSRLTLNTALSTGNPTQTTISTASNLGTLSVAGPSNFRNVLNTAAPTATMNTRGTYNYIGAEQSIDISGLSVGDSAASNIAPNAYPTNSLITGTITINDTDGSDGVGPTMAAVRGMATVTTSVTAAADGVDGMVAGGLFEGNLTHPSTTGGIMSAYGVYAVASGVVDATVGTHGHYGVYAVAQGAGKVNYGAYLAVFPDATDNVGIGIDSALTSGANNYAIRSLSAAQSTFAGSISPSTAGGTTAGTAPLPFSSVFVGNATNNSSQITGTFTANQVATLPDATFTFAGRDLANTFTGLQTFSNGIALNGAANGTTTLIASGEAGTTELTLPAATDTLVGQATSDSLTNKTIGGATNTVTADKVEESGTLPATPASNDIYHKTGANAGLYGPDEAGGWGQIRQTHIDTATYLSGVNYAVDSVGTDAYAITLAPAITALTDGLIVRFKAGTTNTGAATLNVNGLGAKALVKSVGGASTALADGDIIAATAVVAQYVLAADDFKVLSVLGNGGSGVALGDSPTWIGVHTWSPTARTSGANPFARFITPADTGQTANAEFPGIVFGGDASGATVTRTTADGTTIALQREFRFINPTYAAEGATTLTSAATVAIGGAPVAGSNITITNPYALWVTAGNTRLDGGATITNAGGGIKVVDVGASGLDFNSGNTQSIIFRLRGGTGQNAMLHMFPSNTAGNSSIASGVDAAASGTTPYFQIRTTLAARPSLAVDGLTSQTADVFQVRDVSTNNYFVVGPTGVVGVQGTDTAAATTGAQTIDKPSGTVNFAATDTSLVVTNTLVTTTTKFAACQVMTNDTTMKSAVCVPASGSFTIFGNAAATAETQVFWELRTIR